MTLARNGPTKVRSRDPVYHSRAPLTSNHSTHLLRLYVYIMTALLVSYHFEVDKIPF